jgi:hypothetical protein
MAEKRGEEAGVAKGFAGLLSLVSDVDGDIAAAKRMSRVASAPRPQPASAASSRHTNTPRGMILFVGFLAVLSFYLLIEKAKQDSSYHWIPSAPAGTPNVLPSTSAVPSKTNQEQPAVSFIEMMPPVGTENVLNLAQIQYCLSEDIRLKAGKKALDEYSESEVSRYNSLVTDYNSRCAHFSYKKGVLGEAWAAVIGRKSLLQAEGAARFGKPSPAASSLAFEPAPENIPRDRRDSAPIKGSTKPEKVQTVFPTESTLSPDIDGSAIVQCVRSYYQSLQKKDIEGAFKCYAVAARHKIKKSRLAAVAKDTEYYQFDEFMIDASASDNVKSEILLVHKKYNLPQEKWKVTLEHVKEAGAWKIWSISGHKVSP